MVEDDPRLAMIRANAVLVLAELGPLAGETFGYDRPSVTWVDGYIERQRERMTDPDSVGSLVSVLGSWLGEAIIAATGGAWDVHARDEIGVRFPNGDWCFPFSKVAKQFAHGHVDGESITSFYTCSVDLIAGGKTPSGETPQAGADGDSA